MIEVDVDFESFEYMGGYYSGLLLVEGYVETNVNRRDHDEMPYTDAIVERYELYDVTFTEEDGDETPIEDREFLKKLAPIVLEAYRDRLEEDMIDIFRRQPEED